MPMNSRARWLIAAVAALAPFASEAFAASQTGHANAVILAALQINENTPMNFGVIVPPAAGGTVTLTSTNIITGPGFIFIGGSVAGQFTALGTSGQAATISFSSGNSLIGPGVALGLGTFTTDAGGAPAFSPGGILVFHVGANLAVNANQAPGLYQGTYTVTVNY